jgi:hypothetical protein
MATYSPEADGAHGAFRAGLVLSLLSAVLATVWLAARGAPAWLVLAVPLLAASPTPGLHAVRQAQLHQPLELRLGTLEVWRPYFDLTMTGEARASATGGELVLRAPAGSVGHVTLRPLPPPPAYRLDLPRGLTAPGASPGREEIELSAAITRDNVYFGLLETDALRVQLTSWGVMVTASGGARAAETAGVTAPAENGSIHSWSVRRDGVRVTLMRDREVLWTGTDRGRFGLIRLGQGTTDREHGGTLRLRSFRYSASL